MRHAAYGPDLALAVNGGLLRASSEGQPTNPASNGAARRTSYRYRMREDGQTGYVQPIGCYIWLDEPPTEPTWLQVEWAREQLINEVVLHLPILIMLPEPLRTLGGLTVEYCEVVTGRWRALIPTNGQPNPIVDWIAPTAADGSQTRHMSFEALTTSQIRVRFDQGNSDGWSFLDKLEVFWTQPAVEPYALQVPAEPAPGTVVRPGDGYDIHATITDANGLAVLGQPVTVGNEVEATSDRAGRAILRVQTSPEVGTTAFVVTGPASTSRVLQVETQETEAALGTALAWLEEAATGLVHGSRMTAFDGTVMYTPDGLASYAGFWVRDFQHMIEGHPDGVPVDHIRAGFKYLVARQRDDGAMPNKVRHDGVPVYCPGDGCDGIFGPNPPPDNPSFMVKIAFQYWRLTGDLSLFEQHRHQLILGLDFLSRDPGSGLVHIAPTQPSSPYGFTDAIAKTGDQLFDSLLFQEASRNLATMLMAAGHDAEARRWTRTATQIVQDLQSLYDPAIGMFLAASVDCRQVDIWGSAFAVHLGIATDQQRDRIGRYLAANYDGIVVRGQVRHTAPGEYWQRTIVPNRDVYQDGAYWALPAGWVAAAIDHVEPELSRTMLLDLVRDFQENGINEAINPEIGYVAVPEYVASATTVLPALRALVP